MKELARLGAHELGGGSPPPVIVRSSYGRGWAVRLCWPLGPDLSTRRYRTTVIQRKPVCFGRSGAVFTVMLQYLRAKFKTENTYDTGHPPPVFSSEAMGRNGSGQWTKLLPSVPTAEGTDPTSSGRPTQNIETRGTLCRNNHVPAVITLCTSPTLTGPLPHTTPLGQGNTPTLPGCQITSSQTPLGQKENNKPRGCTPSPTPLGQRQKIQKGIKRYTCRSLFHIIRKYI
ncbi:hypothetical protein AVEN_228637-1 [Araneus ventricosus]|uniref:Uncharacterized protein n=1 Tax=Araneus ventricosus TaxID=182803 RepID=A0A4Y2GYV0_ARAVE|nr:hypothetical protein AVEN_228637-1 [Araneus ventricosus]